MKKFNKAGYTAIYPKEGSIITDRFIEQLQTALIDTKRPTIPEEQIYRQYGYAKTVYIKTSRLKRIIEKNEALSGALITEEVKLSDIMAPRTGRLGGIRHGARMNAESYVRKTHQNEKTFIEEQRGEGYNPWPDRVKRWAVPVGLGAMVGSTAIVSGRMIGAATGVADRMADDIVTATSSDEGLDRVLERKAGRQPTSQVEPTDETGDKSFQDKEDERRENEQEERSPGS
ncbi:MAG: hypothetical protein ACN2B6_04065 [Rickettsiales bacterium]